MTRREAGIAAFAAATLVLAVAVVLAEPSARLPALNGAQPPKVSPSNVTGPTTSPSPTDSPPSPVPPANVAISRPEAQEDETEDEPPSAETGSSTSTGWWSIGGAGSGGQSMLPGAARVPVRWPFAPALPAPTPLIP
jgi:hypothetical protein